MRDELKEGEQVLVKVINIDPTGKIRLSRKALIAPETAARRRPDPATKKAPRPAPMPVAQATVATVPHAATVIAARDATAAHE